MPHRQKKHEEPVVPIPSNICFSAEDDGRNPPFEYGSSSPGVMPILAPFSPLFQQQHMWAHDHTITAEEATTGSLQSKGLGIARPCYGDQDTVSKDSVTVASHRIGIPRGNYQTPTGDVPLTPIFGSLPNKSEFSSPAPNLVRTDDSSTSEGGDTPLQMLHNLKLMQQQSEEPGYALLPPPPIQVDDVQRMLHPQTAQGHYLFNSRPIDSPRNGMQYPLSPENRRQERLQVKTRPNTLLHAKPPTPPSSPAAFKIFILLLQPQSKIFEIIQVFYPPSETTVGDLLTMIPVNATEPVLGHQDYQGLTRPQDDAVLNLDFLASASDQSRPCARIACGEVLVAIPQGYTATQCRTLAHPLLTNRRVVKLLQRSDPLAAPSKKQRSRTKAKHHSVPIQPHTSVPSATARRERVQQRSESDKVRLALQHAATQAATTNAQPDDDAASFPDDDRSLDLPVELWKTTHSLRSSFHRSGSLGDSSFDTSLGSSCSSRLDDSFTEWKRIPRRPSRRKRRRHTTLSLQALATALAILTVLVTRFVQVGRPVAQVPAVLGFGGMLHFTIVFVVLVKLQRYGSSMSGGGTACPFVRLLRTRWDHKLTVH